MLDISDDVELTLCTSTANTFSPACNKPSRSILSKINKLKNDSDELECLFFYKFQENFNKVIC